MKRSSSEEGPRPENFPIGSAESRAAARAVIAARERDSEIVEIVCLGPAPLGGYAKYRVDQTGMKLIEGSLPTREQFQAAYEASQRERFDPKGLMGGSGALPRSEETSQPQVKFEQPVPQKAAFDPLAAVHRRRCK